jgi:KaiC/GvpD/RAD55 family RecA-like ATPase
MPNPDEPAENSIACPICGYQSPKGATRCEHCYSSLQADEETTGAGETESNRGQNEGDLEELRLVPGVGEAKAETLHEAGYRSLKDLQNASVDELSAVKGIGEKLAAKIIQGATNLENPSGASPLANWLSGEDEGLSEWLSGEERTQPGATAMKADAPRDESLAKWLAGEEEDVNVWLEEARAPEPAPQTIGPNEVLAREAELIQLRETMREKLSQFESGDFDPQATIEELAKAKGDLEMEKGKARQLEEELENVKRGSIAVIKFIKNQQGSEMDQSTLTDKLASEMANRENLELKIMQLEEVNTTLKEKVEAGIQELPPEAQELKRRETELAEMRAQLEAMKKQLLAKEEALSQGMLSAPPGTTVMIDAGSAQREEESARREQELAARIQELEGKLTETDVLVRQKDEMLKISGGSAKIVDKEVMRKLEDAQRLERTLAVRDQELQRLRGDLKVSTEDLQRLKEPMKYKEEEMLRREEDLMFRERLLQEELKKVTQSKAELTSHGEIDLKKRLEVLQAEVTAKEESIRNKEKYLSAKEEELRLRQQGVISDEIEKRELDRMLEVKQEKVKTGTARLDDLLLGGMPFGANVLVYGPPFTGKEVLLNVFIAEGLKKGIPAIWILTEKSPKDVREEMTFVVSGYEEYEKLGLVRYVDAYSRSMGDDSQDPYAEYVESPTDYESIQRAVETAAKPMREKHPYYRVGFRSISTLIAYLDPGTAFRFLSPVVGRRKRDKAVAMYTIEKGVHGEQEIQMIGSLMDGMIEFKVENLNTFLAIRGICDVQSRSFIRYSATKVGVTIGSFSLDHIR